MSIKANYEEVHAERKRLIALSEKETDKLARHFLKYRASTLQFEEECLKEVLHLFGEEDRSGLLSLYDKLYITYRHEADKAFKEASEYPTGKVKEKHQLRAYELQKRYSQLSILITTHLVRGHVNASNARPYSTEHNQQTIQPTTTMNEFWSDAEEEAEGFSLTKKGAMLLGVAIVLAGMLGWFLSK